MTLEDKIARYARISLELPDFSYGSARKKFEALATPEAVLDIINDLQTERAKNANLMRKDSQDAIRRTERT